MSCITPVTNDPNWSPSDGPKRVQGYCYFCDQFNPDFCPKNGEWRATNLGCNSCKFNGLVGNQCEGGVVIGNGMGCIRTQYNADPAQCCAQNAVVIGDATCDPKFRDSSKPDCQSYMKTTCDNATSFFSAGCKTWLKNISQTRPGTADELANKYCPGSTDPFCACYNIEMPSGLKDSAKGIFRCLNSDCSGNQQALNTLTCPQIYQDCSIADVSVALNKSTIQKVEIANSCCIGGNCPTPSPSPSGPSGSKFPIWIIIGGGSIIAIILLIMILSTTKRQRAKRKR